MSVSKLLIALQRFQKCEYAKTKLFQTEGRGWGLLADENIKVAFVKVAELCIDSSCDVYLLLVHNQNHFKILLSCITGWSVYY